MNIKNYLLKDKTHAILIDYPYANKDKLLDLIAKSLQNGVKIVHFYISSDTDKNNIDFALKLRQLCSLFNALLIINSRLDIAQIAEADGICLNNNCAQIHQIKKIIHNDIIIAKFINSLEDAKEAIKNNYDYITIKSDNINLANACKRLENDIKIIIIDRLKI